MGDVNGSVRSYEQSVTYNSRLIYGSPLSWNHFDAELVRTMAFLGYWYDIQELLTPPKEMI